MANDNPSDQTRRRARHLRRNATEAEKRLWFRLRSFDLNGSHFRRQIPIGPFIADFGCMAARLLIELDGSQHGENQNKLRDEERTRWLEQEGYRVLRFWNNDIEKNINGVMDAIYAAIYGAPSAPAVPLKHQRRSRLGLLPRPTPARDARRPSPCRGG